MAMCIRWCARRRGRKCSTTYDKRVPEGQIKLRASLAQWGAEQRAQRPSGRGTREPEYLYLAQAKQWTAFPAEVRPVVDQIN